MFPQTTKFPHVLTGLFCTLSLARSIAPLPGYSSQVAIYDLNTNSTTVVYRADEVWEAPNWSRDGSSLLANSNGKLFRIPVAHASEPVAIGLDQSLRCNNDHNFSPDGQLIAISASSPASRQSQIYVARADGS